MTNFNFKKTFAILLLSLFCSPLLLQAQFEIPEQSPDSIIFGLKLKVGQKYTYRKIRSEYTTNKWGFPLEIEKDTSYVIIRVMEQLNQLKHMINVEFCEEIDKNFKSAEKDTNNIIKFKTAIIMTNEFGIPNQLYNYSAYYRSIKKSLDAVLKRKFMDSATYLHQLNMARDSNSIAQNVFAQYNGMFSFMKKKYSVNQKYLVKRFLNNPFLGPQIPVIGEFLVTKNYNKNIAEITYDCKNGKDTDEILRLSYKNMLKKYKDGGKSEDENASIEIGSKMYAIYNYNHFSLTYYREIEYLKLGGNWRNSLVSYRLIHLDKR